MSDDDASPQRYGRVVIVGGGCYGSYYVRQLLRAIEAGAVEARELLVVDKDPQCAVARDHGTTGTSSSGAVVMRRSGQRRLKRSTTHSAMRCGIKGEGTMASSAADDGSPAADDAI